MQSLRAQSVSAKRQRTWRPQLYRKCTDAAWLFLFFLFWTGLMFLMGYSVVAGSAGRLLFGYDSFGNVCGKKNSPIHGAPLSGQDMTLRKHVFFLNACNLDASDVRLGSIVLCVASCPDEQLDTLEEVQLFANSSGSFLCVYSLDSFNYTQNPDVNSLCPQLPVPPSKSFPLFNRCIPQTPECYSSFASVLINDLDTLHQILSGIMSGRDTILGLCVLALVLSLAMMFTFRFLTTLLVHILITLIVVGLLFVCSVLWWLYFDYTNDLSIELDTERENMKCLLGFALASTAITAVLLVLIFVLRKRIKLTVELFRVTNKALSSSPLLLVQPLWTFVLLVFFWVLWVAVLLSLGTAGTAQVIEGGQVDYQPLSGIRYMWWYHLIGLIWTSEFILACQQLIVAGTVVTCYFNRNKNDPPDHPILSSLSILCCYHQGTVVKGSFLITVVRIPRIVLLHIYNTLKGKQHSALSRYVLRCCFCCSWSLDKCLGHLNQNAYIATAINGTDFCTSAKDALRLLSKNSSQLASVSCFGNFVIFLGKVLVVCFTVFGGLMAFNYNRALQLWAIPLLLVAFFAYLVAHGFLSVFETVLDALCLCFAVDLETNDGSSEKPYFMDQEFLEICVGILGNMACFPEICVSISNNKDLGEVLLHCFYDSDPPTLLETSRLLLTCLSQTEVASIWVERIGEYPSIYDSICFILSSSTNVDLLGKIGEVVDKLFDLDEKLMLEWIRKGAIQPPDPPQEESEEQPVFKIVPCVLEAAKQVRSEHPEGLDVYMRILQLLTTVDDGIQAIVQCPDTGKDTWSLLFDLVCHEFCQSDDPPIVLQEQKTVLASVFSVLSAIYASQAEQEYLKRDKVDLPLIDSLIRVLQNMEHCQKKPENSAESDPEDTKQSDSTQDDFHLKILKDISCEFLSNIFQVLTKERVALGLKEGQLSKDKCSCAFRHLLPFYSPVVEDFLKTLHEVDKTLARDLEESFPSLKAQT